MMMQPGIVLVVEVMIFPFSLSNEITTTKPKERIIFQIANNNEDVYTAELDLNVKNDEKETFEEFSDYMYQNSCDVNENTPSCDKNKDTTEATTQTVTNTTTGGSSGSESPSCDYGDCNEDTTVATNETVSTASTGGSGGTGGADACTILNYVEYTGETDYTEEYTEYTEYTEDAEYIEYGNYTEYDENTGDNATAGAAGGPYTHTQTSCAETCHKSPICRYWTFDSNSTRCWHHNEDSSAEKNTGIVSGNKQCGAPGAEPLLDCSLYECDDRDSSGGGAVTSGDESAGTDPDLDCSVYEC